MTRIDRIFFWNILTIFLFALPRISEAQLDPAQEFRFNDFNHHCVDASGHNVLDRDVDEDGTDDWLDTCATVANPGQEDGDRDGIGDACDQCPSEGIPETVMGDDLHDCLDPVGGPDTNPPGGHNNAEYARIVGADGCLISCTSMYTASSTSRFEYVCPCSSSDQMCQCAPSRSGYWVSRTVEPNGPESDDDYVVDVADNCPQVRNNHVIRGTHDFRDRDGDGIGDACDKCLFDSNPGQEDGDSDGIPDACDNCASVANAHQEDEDCNGVGNVCEGGQGGDRQQTQQQQLQEHLMDTQAVHIERSDADDAGADADSDTSDGGGGWSVKGSGGCSFIPPQ